MRALRVVGVTGDGSVVLEDSDRHERYTVPADEQLRAAARGDVTRLGQIAIELESQLRPREIQARIRGGASVDQVAAAAGVPVQKIERFAYPVLLERSRTAELAQGAHPQRADGPDIRTLGETVAHTFGLRGQDYTAAGWDSWKGDDGKWVVALSWRAGKSDNIAHWAFQPGAHGGTVVALDEHASDLVEGLPMRPLRTVGPVIDLGRDEEPDTDEPESPHTSTQVRAAVAGETRTADTRRGIAPEQRRASPTPPSRGSVAAAPPARGAFDVPGGADASDPAPAAGGTDRATDEAGPVDRAADAETTDGTDGTDAVVGAATAPTASTATTEPARAAEPAATEATGTAAPAEATATTGSADTSERAGSTGPADTAAADSARAAEPAGATETAGTAGGRARDDGGRNNGAAAVRGDDPAGPGGTLDTAGDPGDTADDTADTGHTEGGEDSGPARPARSGGNRRTKKGKPVMPSWDEVLLGVRGQR